MNKQMIDMTDRAEYLSFKENTEKYLQQNPDRKVVFERVLRIEMECLFANNKHFGLRHIIIKQPFDVFLNKDFIDAIEKMDRGESDIIDKPITISTMGLCEMM